MTSLHPALRRIVDDALHGAGADASNLCVVIGTLIQSRWRDGTVRTTQTPVGGRQAVFTLAVQEVVGDETGAALSNYQMPLAFSTRLLESGPFVADGQRIAVCGPLRLERSYDQNFARDDLDAGLPVWRIRLDPITVQAVADDMPDGSWVQLEGEIAGTPIIRHRPIGPRISLPFASIHLRYQRRLDSPFVRDRAKHPTTSIIPLEAPLDGLIEQAGALLRNANQVRVEGRLTPYAFRRRPADPQVAAALARLAASMRARGGPRLDARIRSAQQRLLNVVEIVAGVGYVERRQGSVLTDEEIAQLIAERPRRVHMPGTAERLERDEPDSAIITQALDTATNAALGKMASNLSGNGAGATTHPRPRRRVREQAQSAADQPDDA
jgi:hypothetical protein